MNYSEDIRQVIMFISTIESSPANDDKAIECINRFTATIGESFLDLRSRYILEEIEKNEELKKAFSSLASLCSDQYCDQCPVKKYCNTYIQSVRSLSESKSLKMVDLFCGAGGLSLGFTQEGFVTVLANDIEPCCIDTYAHNHPEIPQSRIVQGDIRTVVENLGEYLRDYSVDIVVGGPPCQGFSMANRQRLIDDPRNHLYKSFVDVVNIVKPTFFVMENVKGMLSVASQVVEDFQRIGYQVSYQVLNAKDFGVPQNRERLIYIGNCIGIDNANVFSDLKTKANTIPNHVLDDALFGLKPLKASRKKNSTEFEDDNSGSVIARDLQKAFNEYIDLINQGRRSNIVLNHKARYNNDRDIEIFGRLNPGDRSDDPKIADIMPYSRRNDIFKDKYFKLEGDKVCKTITAHMKFDCNMYIHPTQARGLTPREAARVQSFPDDYFFRGAYTKTYMQIGNSVPPLLSRSIASVVKCYIFEYKKLKIAEEE